MSTTAPGRRNARSGLGQVDAAEDLVAVELACGVVDSALRRESRRSPRRASDALRSRRPGEWWRSAGTLGAQAVPRVAYSESTECS